MGSESFSKSEDLAEWTVERQQGNRLVMRNDKTKSLVEQYVKYYYDSNEMQAAEQALARRKLNYKSADNVVRLLKFWSENKGGAFCGGRSAQLVAVEGLQIRLPGLGRVSDDKAVYLLSEMLDGYATIMHVERRQDFKVDQRMVGITPRQEVRVWFNEDFSECQPSLLQPYQTPDRQDELVKSIVAMALTHAAPGLDRQLNRYLDKFAPRPFRIEEVSKAVINFAGLMHQSESINYVKSKAAHPSEINRLAEPMTPIHSMMKQPRTEELPPPPQSAKWKLKQIISLPSEPTPEQQNYTQSQIKLSYKTTPTVFRPKVQAFTKRDSQFSKRSSSLKKAPSISSQSRQVGQLMPSVIMDPRAPTLNQGPRVEQGQPRSRSLAALSIPRLRTIGQY